MATSVLKYISLNGIIRDASLPVWLPDDRLSRYGDGVFESIRMIKGEVMFWDDHMRRLKAGIKALKIKIPLSIRNGNLLNEIKELAQKNHCFGNARIRIQVGRGNGGLYTPEESQSTYLISADAIEEKEYVLNKKGLFIDIYEDLNKPINFLSEFKTCNALIYVMAGIWKKEKKLDECLILNENLNISESLSSNVFFVRDNVIYTPATDEGCIHGVMRNNVIRLATKAGYKVIDCVISSKDIDEMDEIFLTNASTGIRWVAAYRQKRYFNTTASQLTKMLNA